MKRPFMLLTIAVAIAGCCTCDQPCDSGTTYIKDALQPFVDRGELSGAIGILYNNGVQETCCVGYADVEAKRPITIDDAFMQCSQTKGFCGVTVAKLVEEGKLKLDDPVSKYLPEFAELTVKVDETNGTYKVIKATKTLTVRMCMNHTGGFNFELPNFTRMGGWSRRMPLRSVAAIAASIPLLFEPGTKDRYSNVGIDIGAAVVEVITGKRWEAYLQETVLDPLGMENSTFWPSDEMLETAIGEYTYKKGGQTKRAKQYSMQAPYGDDRVFSSAGAGLWTTARDQLKFYKMLMNLGLGDNGVRILKEDTVKSLLASSTRPEGMGGYSMGLSAPDKFDKYEWFGHGGAWCTTCSVNWHKRQLRMWVVQHIGGDQPWIGEWNKAYDKFFAVEVNDKGAGAYTGRLD